MAIRIGPEVERRIREEGDDFVIQIQGAREHEAAIEAMRRAMVDISNLDGGWQSAHGLRPEDRNGPALVTEVMPAGSGPFILIDCGDMPAALCQTIPELVVARLREQGVDDAVVATPERHEPTAVSLREPWRAIVLRLFPPPLPHPEHADIPDAWLARACRWVVGDLPPEHELRGDVGGMEFPLRAADALTFLLRCRAERNMVASVATEADGRVRACWAGFRGLVPSLALGGGGGRAGESELLQTFERLRDVARSFAPELAQAVIGVEPGFMFDSGCNEEWYREHGGASDLAIEPLCDRYLFDAFAYQVLGPGHIEQLGGVPPGAVALPGRRVELLIGEPAAWMLDPWLPDGGPWHPWWRGLSSRRRDPQIQSDARALLARCLLTNDKARRILREVRAT